MLDCRADQSVLLVADVPGHIIERIGLSWIHHVTGVRHELFHSTENQLSTSFGASMMSV